MEPNFTYLAFISYSQKDERFAKEVQHYLEHYRLPSVLCRAFPTVPRSFHPIFRDKTDLPLDNLSNALTDALSTSRHLIVICSSHSASLNADGKNWVNWEVETFISLRPENSQRVIPIILCTKDGDAAIKLPSSIRERPFSLLNTAELGKERTFNNAIARMTGLNPATLWELQLNRIKRRKFFRRLCGTAAVLLTAASGWWYWDYYFPHYSYYVDYVEHNNIPCGLFPLKKNELTQHATHYRFTERLHVLEAVEYRNKSGENIDHTVPWHKSRPARMELSYTREAGRDTVEHRRHLNAAGKPYETLIFSQGAIDIEAHATSPHTLTAEQPNACRKCRLAVTRNSDGIITRTLYNKYGSTAGTTNELGMYGLDYELDEQGRIKAVHYLSAQLTPSGELCTIVPGETTEGIAGYLLSYDDAAHTARMTCIDKEGKPITPNQSTTK